jgi:hypothetical protein
LPAAGAKTQRQELQRAFAQEFLCPSSDPEAFLEDKPVTDDAIEDDAVYFDVSPLLVRTELVNKHRLDQAHPCVTTEQAHCSVRSEALNPQPLAPDRRSVGLVQNTTRRRMRVHQGRDIAMAEVYGWRRADQTHRMTQGPHRVSNVDVSITTAQSG